MNTRTFALLAFLFAPLGHAASLAPTPALPAFHDIARKAVPAVVNISSTRSGTVEEAKSMGVGSGVIIRNDGLIVTSYHVIDGATRVTITLHGQTENLPATVVAGDPRTDIALLRLDKTPPNLPTLRLGDSDRVRVGDWAVAVGNPFGFHHTVTCGIISARGRNGSAMGPYGEAGPDVDDMIQTDAAINPGNSGGPLLNAEGEMVGLNSAIFSQNGAFIGIGFAIPSKIVREITDQLLAKGRVVRGWIGVTAQNLDEHLARRFSTEKRGALISDLRPNGPAALARLQVGDVIKSFDHTEIVDSPTLKSQVAKTGTGRTIDIDYWRNGKSGKTQLTIMEQPSARPDPNGTAPKSLAGRVAENPKKLAQSPADLGLTFQNVPADLRALMSLPAKEGVLVAQITPGSLAQTAGVSAGDVLLQVEREPVASSDDVSRKITQWLRRAKPLDSLLLLIQRNPGERIFIAVPKVEN